MEWRGRGGVKAQTKSPVKVEMQFIEHHRKQFLAVHGNSMLNCAMSIFATIGCWFNKLEDSIAAGGKFVDGVGC